MSCYCTKKCKFYFSFINFQNSAEEKSAAFGFSLRREGKYKLIKTFFIMSYISICIFYILISLVNCNDDEIYIKLKKVKNNTVEYTVIESLTCICLTCDISLT